MAVSRRTKLDEGAATAGKAAASAATMRPEKSGNAGRTPQRGELLSIRIDPIDKELMKKTFNENGVTLAGGIKLSALYVLQELKAGRLNMTKAGLFPGR
jgi:hypothetical protein